MRTVEIFMGQEEHEKIEAITGSKELFKALGYLSTWASDSYPKVNIYANANDGELTACYLDKDGNRGYVIGAIWHGDYYGFHS